MLAQLGVVAADQVSAARDLLEAEGLTNPRKTNISLAKREAVTAAIDTMYRRLCTRCAADVEAGAGTAGAVPTGGGPDERPILRVAQPNCTRCGGSNNQRAVDEMLAACARAKVTRIVFVGGSPSIRQELMQMLGDALELRLVEGTRSIARAAADADIAWADLVVVLGTSQLAHKVSQLYTDDPAARKKAITVRRRGIESIATAITSSDRVTGDPRGR